MRVAIEVANDTEKLSRAVKAHDAVILRVLRVPEGKPVLAEGSLSLCFQPIALLYANNHFSGLDQAQPLYLQPSGASREQRPR